MDALEVLKDKQKKIEEKIAEHQAAINDLKEKMEPIKKKIYDATEGRWLKAAKLAAAKDPAFNALVEEAMKALEERSVLTGNSAKRGRPPKAKAADAKAGQQTLV